MSDADLKKYVKQFIAEHESLRSAARFLGITPGHLSRLASGERTNPSHDLLDAMGIHRMVIYQRFSE